MANRYRVSGGRGVLAAAPGEEFEHDFTEQEETDLLARGAIEIVAREYEVTGPRTVHGAAPGERFTAGLRVGEEAALLAAGHITRVEQKPAGATRKKRSES